MSSQLPHPSPLFEQITRTPPGVEGLRGLDSPLLQAQLRDFIAEKEAALARAPEGTLTVKEPRRRSTSPEYYCRVGNTQAYLGAKQKQLIEALAQKEYDEKQLREAKRLLKETERLEARDLLFQDTFEKLSPSRRELLSPDYLSDRFVRDLWETITFDSLGFPPNYPEYYTDAQLRVRSIPERIIGNELERQHVLFLYEYPYHMVDGGIVYPDFTCLNLRTRKLYLWEHLGRLNEPKYMENNLRKLDRYRASGIRLGINLIVSHDSDRHPFTVKDARELISHYLL